MQISFLETIRKKHTGLQTNNLRIKPLCFAGGKVQFLCAHLRTFIELTHVMDSVSTMQTHIQMFVHLGRLILKNKQIFQQKVTKDALCRDGSSLLELPLLGTL